MGGRFHLVGPLLDPSHPFYKQYVGKTLHDGPVRSPIFYGPAAPRPCACGCGEVIKIGDFKPGHEITAVRERVTEVGSAKDFVDWFDRTWRAA